MVAQPTAATTAGWYTFSIPAKICFINNDTGKLIYVRFNNYAAADVYDLIVPDGDAVRCLYSDYHVDYFKGVGVWVETGGDTSKIVITYK